MGVAPITSASADVESETRGHDARAHGFVVRAAGVAILSLALGIGGTMLVERSRGGATSSSTASTAMNGMSGMNGSSESSPVPPRPAGAGSKTVYISTARQQLIGVRTAKAARHAVGGELRAVGTLTYDETRVTEIHARISGWVDKVYVDFVGKPVRRGAPLFSLYSPDLVTAQSEYLVAIGMESDAVMHGSIADALVAASHQRLRRLGVEQADIDELARTRKVRETITLYSPFDGVVLEREAFAGQYITPDTKTFKIADLSTIWAVGQVFDDEAARLRVGQRVDVEFPNDASMPAVPTSISFIYPGVDPETRRVRFRTALRNDKLALKPDTFVTMVIAGDASAEFAVPREAVIDTGARQYVLLALPDGYFEPRDVRIGAAIGDEYPIESGLSEGDSVVVSAQFLVDSETNLMEAMQNMAMTMPGMDMGGSAPTATGSSTATAMPGMNMGAPKSSATSAKSMASSPPNGGKSKGMDAPPSSGSTVDHTHMKMP